LLQSNGVKEHAMNRKHNENQASSEKVQPEQGAHLPPELNRAEIDRAKDMEADLNAQQPEDPVLQMRESPNRRKKRRQSAP
jgi:hypothetical protein